MLRDRINWNLNRMQHSLLHSQMTYLWFAEFSSYFFYVETATEYIEPAKPLRRQDFLKVLQQIQVSKFAIRVTTAIPLHIMRAIRNCKTNINILLPLN